MRELRWESESWRCKGSIGGAESGSDPCGGSGSVTGMDKRRFS